MPNLSAILEKYPQIKAAITQDDGKIYGLPAAEMMGTGATGAADDYSIHSIQQFSMINKAWLDDLGLAVPETVEELRIALQAFKDNDMAHKMYGADAGSTIPMSFGFDQWCWGQNIFYAPNTPPRPRPVERSSSAFLPRPPWTCPKAPTM